MEIIVYHSELPCWRASSKLMLELESQKIKGVTINRVSDERLRLIINSGLKEEDIVNFLTQAGFKIES